MSLLVEHIVLLILWSLRETAWSATLSTHTGPLADRSPSPASRPADALPFAPPAPTKAKPPVWPRALPKAKSPLAQPIFTEVLADVSHPEASPGPVVAAPPAPTRKVGEKALGVAACDCGRGFGGATLDMGATEADRRGEGSRRLRRCGERVRGSGEASRGVGDITAHRNASPSLGDIESIAFIEPAAERGAGVAACMGAALAVGGVAAPGVAPSEGPRRSRPKGTAGERARARGAGGEMARGMGREGLTVPRDVVAAMPAKSPPKPVVVAVSPDVDMPLMCGGRVSELGTPREVTAETRESRPTERGESGPAG